MIPPQSLRVYTKTKKVNFLIIAYDNNKDSVLGLMKFKNFLVDLGYPNPTSNNVNWFISLIYNKCDFKISWSELYNSLQ
jgi:hypothetical protein